MSRLILIGIVLVVIEIPVFHRVKEHIDAGPTLLLMVGTAMLGSWMVLRGMTFHAARHSDIDDLGPRQLLLDPAGSLLAGVFLFAPGFVTDALGVVLVFIAPLRRLGGALLLRWVRPSVRPTPSAPSPGETPTAEGEPAHDAGSLPAAAVEAGAPSREDRWDEASTENVPDATFEVVDAPVDDDGQCS